MPMPDDLSPLKAKPFDEAVRKLEELMTQSGRAFLFGAGCSKCAGLPLTAELTSKVLANTSLDDNTKEILTALQTHFIGATDPNIEDYLSELVDFIAIAERRRVRGATKKEMDLAGRHYDARALSAAAEQIKSAIADAIDQPVSIETHWNFIKAVHSTVRPGK